MFLLWNFYLIDKHDMLPFGSIRLLRFHTWNCVSIFVMFLLMHTKVSLLLYKDLMLLFGSIRLLQLHFWNCVKHSFYASYNHAKSFLPRKCTPLYFQEQGHTFVHTLNSLVVQEHHQNVQICSQNILLKQILANVSVIVPLHIPVGPYIASPTNISTTSTSDMPHPPTYEHLHRYLLPKRYGKNELGPY